MKYEIDLTDTQDLALQYVALSPLDWITNVVYERCRIATDEIVQIAVERYLSEGIQIPGSKDDIVLDAFARGWVVKAADLPNPVV